MIRLFLLISLSFPFLMKVHAQEVSTAKPALKLLDYYPNVRDFTLSASGKEAYLTVQSPLEESAVIVRITKEKGEWSNPEMVSFTGDYRDIEPFLAPDGLRLYFASNRPLTDEEHVPKDYDIWYVERKSQSSPWSEPVNLGQPVNTEHNEFYPSVTLNGNLYFTTDSPETKGKDDIFFSAWEAGRFVAPVSLSDAVNTEGYEYNAFVAPDESFLIFGAYKRADGLGSGDLYISFRQEDGSWRKAENLGGQVNSPAMDYCPFVDMKTKTLYFTSRRSTVKKRGYSTLEEFLEEAKKYENGFSRIYKVSLEEQFSQKAFSKK